MMIGSAARRIVTGIRITARIWQPWDDDKPLGSRSQPHISHNSVTDVRAVDDRHIAIPKALRTALRVQTVGVGGTIVGGLCHPVFNHRIARWRLKVPHP